MTVRPVLRVQPGRDTVTPEGDHLRVILHRNGNPTLDAALSDPRTVIRLGNLSAPIYPPIRYEVIECQLRERGYVVKNRQTGINETSTEVLW